MSTDSILPSSTVPQTKDKVLPETAIKVVPNGVGSVAPWRSIVVVALAFLVVMTYLLDPPMEVLPKAGVVMSLPLIVGDFFGKTGQMSDVEAYQLPKDTEFARRYYVDTHGHEVDTTIVLSGAEQRSIHRPEGCLVGQGWTIVGQENIPINLLSGRTLIARKLSLERQVVKDDGGHVPVRAFYVYWFVGQNITTPSHFTRILLSNWDRVIHNRAHRWAYVSMFSVVTDTIRPDGINADKTLEIIKDFTKHVVPGFQVSEMPAQAKN